MRSPRNLTVPAVGSINFRAKPCRSLTCRNRIASQSQRFALIDMKADPIDGIDVC